MRVHIVCKEPNPERIIRRLAAQLAEATGWSMSATSRRDVDVNYFFPYLDFEHVDTLTAAWHTHRDDAHPEKVARWNKAADLVDLRLTSARLYLDGLSAHGPVAQVPPPIDHNRFHPIGAESHLLIDQTLRVGVSGYSYNDGRKGEDLVKLLLRELKTVRFDAIGRGWGGKTKHIETPDLPAWYQSLGLYVCASRVEGVPMTVLEALACGVPVVIPRGVGLLDELPDDPLIWRYPAGDYGALRKAVEQAHNRLTMQPITYAEQLVLHRYTLGYSLAAWGAAHVAAFERYLDPVDDTVLHDWRTPTDEGSRAGIYIVAFGAPARACAQRLLLSCRQYMPEVETMLASTAPLGIETHFKALPDYDIGGRLAKLQVDLHAPAHWQYVLYLDADTELIAPVPHFFDVLEAGWELTICTNPGKYHTTRAMVRPDNKQEVKETFDVMGFDDLMQLNGGVFAYRRSPRTARFFTRWIAEWMQYAKRDQAALLRALWTVPLRLYLLTNVWNSMDSYNDATQSAGVLHHQQEARRVSGIVDHRGDSPEAFKKVIR